MYTIPKYFTIELFPWYSITEQSEQLRPFEGMTNVPTRSKVLIRIHDRLRLKFSSLSYNCSSRKVGNTASFEEDLKKISCFRSEMTFL